MKRNSIKTLKIRRIFRAPGTCCRTMKSFCFQPKTDEIGGQSGLKKESCSLIYIMTSAASTPPCACFVWAGVMTAAQLFCISKEQIKSINKLMFGGSLCLYETATGVRWVALAVAAVAEFPESWSLLICDNEYQWDFFFLPCRGAAAAG